MNTEQEYTVTCNGIPLQLRLEDMTFAQRRQVEAHLRPTRWNDELQRREALCCGHWWGGDCCLYGKHDLR